MAAIPQRTAENVYTPDVALDRPGLAPADMSEADGELLVFLASRSILCALGGTLVGAVAGLVAALVFAIDDTTRDALTPVLAGAIAGGALGGLFGGMMALRTVEFWVEEDAYASPETRAGQPPTTPWIEPVAPAPLSEPSYALRGHERRPRGASPRRYTRVL
jgi:hypothetical protein